MVWIFVGGFYFFATLAEAKRVESEIKELKEKEQEMGMQLGWQYMVEHTLLAKSNQPLVRFVNEYRENEFLFISKYLPLFMLCGPLMLFFLGAKMNRNT